MFTCRSQLMMVSVLVAVFSMQDVCAENPQIDLQTDSLTGLIKAPDWELVRNNCIACHSSRLITQQSGNASQWLGVIRWMQEKQNLWQFDPDTETKIIAYLAENYPPRDASRRSAIPPELMPPNPFVDEATSTQEAH